MSTPLINNDNMLYNICFSKEFSFMFNVKKMECLREILGIHILEPIVSLDNFMGEIFADENLSEEHSVREYLTVI